jgi:hypothetical protein
MADAVAKPVVQVRKPKGPGVAIPAVAAAAMFARRPAHPAPTWPPANGAKAGGDSPWPAAPGISRFDAARLR